MKKINNGFTLIEILAVITILGVLTSIAIPSINYFNTKQKEKAYFMEEELVLESAKEFAKSNQYMLFNNTNCNIIDTKMLIENGFYEIKKDIINPKTKENIKNLKIVIDRNNTKSYTSIMKLERKDCMDLTES